MTDSKAILLKMLKPYWSRLLQISILSSLGAALEVVSIYFLVTLANMAMTGESQHHISLQRVGLSFDLQRRELIGIGLVIVVSRFLILIFKSWLTAKVGVNYFALERKRLFSLFWDSSWEQKNKASAGELQTILTTNLEKGRAVLFSMIHMLSVAMQVLVVLLSAFYLNIYLAFGIIAAGIFMFILIRPVTKMARKAAKVDAELSVLYGEEVLESVSLAKEIDVFGVKEHLMSKVNETVDKTKEKQAIAVVSKQVIPILYQSSVFLMAFVALASISLSESQGIEVIGVTVMLMLRMVSYLQNIQSYYHEMSQRVPFLEQFAKSVDAYFAAQYMDGSEEITDFKKFTFENVSFRYDASKIILDKVSFEIKSGEFIGLIGSSGAGKSTLLQLLLGLYAPQKGVIKINNIAFNDLKRIAWLKKLAFVPQSASILKGSIEENVRFYREWIGTKDVKKSLDEAYLTERISELNKGIQTQLKGEGVNLSGGEEQRICIARALAGSPQVLILDEPTSSLDALSEKFIQKTIDELRGQKTIIAIAHRVSTLDSCDRIMVLNNGKLEAFDSPENLYKNNDFYRQTRQALEREGDHSI